LSAAGCGHVVKATTSLGIASTDAFGYELSTG